MVEPSCLNFRVITAIFQVSKYLGILRYLFSMWTRSHWRHYTSTLRHYSLVDLLSLLISSSIYDLMQQITDQVRLMERFTCLSSESLFSIRTALFIFTAINFQVLPLHVYGMSFRGINFHIDLALALIEVQNFCSNSFSWKLLPLEYCENKSLTKLNRFTVSLESVYFFPWTFW